MSYNPNNPNGATTAANSAPVALATDQLSTLATASNQSTGNTSLSSIATNTSTAATNTTGLNNAVGTAASAIPSKLLQVGGSDGTNARALKTDTSGNLGVNVQGTVPVSGTFWQTTQPVSAASLPLPTGAAQDATLTGGTARTKVTDGTNNAAVKAASTAAVATDPALVVAVSPNNSVAVTGTFWQATQPVSLATNTPTLQAGSAIIGKVGIDQTTPGTTNLVQVGGSLPAGTNTIGKVSATTSTTGGATAFQLISAASTNATSVKASAGTVYGVQAFNNGAAAAYVKLYNKASAPTVGTDTPIKTVMLPAGGGAVIPLNDAGDAFGTGIAFAITGGMAVSDTTAVAATQVAVNIDYV